MKQTNVCFRGYTAYFSVAEALQQAGILVQSSNLSCAKMALTFRYFCQTFNYVFVI